MAQPNSAPSSAPVSVIGSQFIAQDQFDIIIDRYSNGNLLITDINHKILLKVKPCTTHFHSQLVVLDADDKPIVTIREQSLSAHSGMNVFRGDSKNKSDLIFHTKKHHLIQFKTGVDVFLGNKASGKHDYDFNIKGKWSKKDCTINRGDTSATIAQMYKKQSTDKKKFVDDKFMMTIYPAVDYAFVVTLIAIVEAMEMESTSNTGEYLTATDKVHDFTDTISLSLCSFFLLRICNRPTMHQLLLHKELTFNRPKTEISADCEIEMDLPTGLKESSPSRQKSESSPSSQKSTPTAMKFKTEISADCEIEKDLKIARDMKRKQALLNWKWDAVIDLEDDASDDGWDADEENDSDEDYGSDGHSETELTTTPPRKTVKRPRVTVNKRHRPSVVSQEWTWA